MTKARLFVFALVIALLGAGLAVLSIRSSQAEEEAVEAYEARRQARIERREREAAEQVAALRQESGPLMPAALGGVELGMTQEELTSVRSVQPKLGQGEEDQTFFEEELENGARVVYGVDDGDRLRQIQVMSMVESADAIAQHIRAMIDRYGQPTGIWNCPQTGNVPTRRFTWRKTHATVADVFLLYGNRAAITFYVAPTERIGESLQRAACRPVQSPEDLAEFPQASLEQIRQAQGAQ